MTKKVLIGFDDLIGAMHDICFDDCAVSEFAAEKWFNAQPAVIMATYTVEPGREDLEEESVLSKMEITESAKKSFKDVLDDNYSGII